MINKLRVKRFILLLLIVFSCKNTEEYNYKFYGKDSLGKKVLFVKGNMINNKPNGKFIFYNHEGNFLGKGSYINGVKYKEWDYSFLDEKFSLEWKEIKINDIRLSIPEKMKTHKSEDYLFEAFEFKDSSTLIKSRIYLRDHNLKNQSLNQFGANFFNDVKKSNLNMTFDYTKQFKNSYHNNDIFYQFYSGLDDNKNEIAVFFLLILDINKPEKVYELTYVTPLSESTINNFIYNEIILDIHFSNKPVFDRWSLDIMNNN